MTCDIPASRKVLSHNASKGCNKYLKKFNVEFGESTDFLDLTAYFKCKANSAANYKNWQGISRVYDRYSVLLELPYFDPVECTTINSMHNLFLATGKHTFSVWIETDTLTKQNLKELEKRIDVFCSK